jgi:hypothetical protein
LAPHKESAFNADSSLHSFVFPRVFPGRSSFGHYYFLAPELTRTCSAKPMELAFFDAVFTEGMTPFQADVAMYRSGVFQVGLLMSLSLSVMADDDSSRLDDLYVARCKWGRSVAGVAQENVLAGHSRRDFLVSLDNVAHPEPWMPRMTRAIGDSVYKRKSEMPVSVVQERYMSDCLQYYLAK